MIGVDVGGTKIAAGAVESASGTLLSRVEQPTLKSKPSGTLERIAETIAQAIAAAGQEGCLVGGVGLGVPGRVDPVLGIAARSIHLGWRDTHAAASIERLTGLPCAIENDANAATLGEAAYGAARGARNFVYLNIGTGIGAGIVVNGALYRGKHGMAGDIGHAVVDPAGTKCGCGTPGCLEALASGPAVVRDMESAASRRSTSDRADVRISTARDVFAAARSGDPAARSALATTGRSVAFAIRWLTMAVDPELIVLGGGVATDGRLLLDEVIADLKQQAAESWVFREVFDPDAILVSELGANAGVLGAAALAAESFTKLGPLSPISLASQPATGG